MSLASPGLKTIHQHIMKYNVSTFWTGFERFDENFFYEKATKAFLNCRMTIWPKKEIKEQSDEMNFSQQLKIKKNKRCSVTEHPVQSEWYSALVQEMIQYKRKCSDWNSKRKLLAILINNRHIGYKTSNKYSLSSRVSCKSKTLKTRSKKG